MTYLHLAVEGAHTNTVEYLVGKEAGINTKGDHGVSVSDYTSENRLFENRSLLV